MSDLEKRLEGVLRDLEDIANNMSCMTQYTRHKADQIISAVNRIREALSLD